MTTPPSSSRKKWLWAGAALCGIVLAGVMIRLYAPTLMPAKPQPSELTLHPEKQDEILVKNAIDRLAGPLQLTDPQREEVTPLVKALREDLRRLRRENTGGLPELLSAGRTRMDAFMHDMEKILTPEQQKSFEAIRSERRASVEMLRGMLPGGRF